MLSFLYFPLRLMIILFCLSSFCSKFPNFFISCYKSRWSKVSFDWIFSNHYWTCTVLIKIIFNSHSMPNLLASGLGLNYIQPKINQTIFFANLWLILYYFHDNCVLDNIIFLSLFYVDSWSVNVYVIDHDMTFLSGNMLIASNSIRELEIKNSIHGLFWVLGVYQLSLCLHMLTTILNVFLK